MTKFVASIKAKNKRTPIENLMDDHLRLAGIRGYLRNATFIEGRRFQADFWFPRLRLALEVDGGVWMKQSGHTSGVGYTSDRVRDIEALLQGTLTVRYTSEQIRSGYAIETFKKIFEARAKGLGVSDS